MVEIIRKGKDGGVNPSTLQPEPVPQMREFNDGVRMIDPNTGRPIETELDQLDLPPGNDWVRAIYQVFAWAAGSFVTFARTTPSLAALSPDMEKTMDQVCTVGYQVTNAGAELSRGLWNWPMSRVNINKQLESVFYPEETKMFDRLFVEWYNDLVGPVEAGIEPYNKDKVRDWLKSKPEIADPQGFQALATARLRTERAAEKSMWTPTDMFKMSMPGGERRMSREGMDIRKVFRKPG